jgi:hypothetical protein
MSLSDTTLSFGASQKGKEIERPSQLDSLIEPDATESINNDQNISSGSLISETTPQLEQHEDSHQELKLMSFPKR